MIVMKMPLDYSSINQAVRKVVISTERAKSKQKADWTNNNGGQDV
jgi:hypothetical protein